jgi:tryptophan synthase beta chain
MSKQYDIQKGGYYGPNQDYGGQYVPEILLPSLEELTKAFYFYKSDSEFLDEYNFLLKNFVGRPSPLIEVKNLTKLCGGGRIFLKNEGNNLTGSHKINHCLFQALIAQKMGKTKIICETGAGQHGVASAVVCAKFGLELEVYMGQKDIERQYPNVFFMKQLGAKVIPVTNGNQKLTSAVDAAISAWISSPESYYMLGSAVGPHPYPEIMRYAQSIVSKEISSQLSEFGIDYPDAIVACIGGGSNAIGAFNEFLYDDRVRLIGIEAGGKGTGLGQHSSRLGYKQAVTGIFEGFKSKFLLLDDGNLADTNGVSAGLGYVGIGPLHAYLYETKRLEIITKDDKDTLEAFQTLAQKEGLIAALESCHAVSAGIELAKSMLPSQSIVINLSGRGDNYLFNIAKGLGDKGFEVFLKTY